MLMILALLVALAALVFVSYMLLRPDTTRFEGSNIDSDTETVRLDGEIMMVSHDALHHPVAALVTAKLGRKIVGSTTVDENNAFSMQIPADVRGEVEVALALHGGSTSLVDANGSDLHTVVIYNPVNNFFA